MKLLGKELAVNPDLFELITRANGVAEQLAARYAKAGPFHCAEHAEGAPSIELTAVFGSAVKVRQLKFCCEGLAEQVNARMALEGH